MTSKETPSKPVLFSMVAKEDTWLKKSMDPADALPDDQKVAVPLGKQLTVVGLREIPGNSHEQVDLSHSGGTWHIFAPHFQRVQAPTAASTATASAQPAVIDWSDFSSLVTPNLTVGEVLQFDSRRCPRVNSAVTPRILETAAEFQAIRNAWGPLGVTSFYRPEPINRQVGGVSGSQHVTGLAMDIYPVGMPLQALYDFLLTRWTGGFGDGRGRGFIHLDRRAGGRFVPGGGVRPSVVWTY
jgi:hypothetical protein